MKLEESEEKKLYSSTNDEDINQSIIRNDCLVILLVVFIGSFTNSTRRTRYCFDMCATLDELLMSIEIRVFEMTMTIKAVIVVWNGME